MLIIVHKKYKTVAISRIQRGVIMDMTGLFIACKICFACIIHAIHVKMYKAVGRALGIREGMFIFFIIILLFFINRRPN